MEKERALWVIGDIHGMYDPLRRIIDRIRAVEYFESPDSPDRDTSLIFVGDYIDYGPSSKQVVDLLLEVNKEFHCVFLCGNHEDMMLQFLRDSDLFQRFGNMWFRGAGGQNTVVSFMPHPNIYRRVYGTSDDDRKFTKDDVLLDPVYQDFFDSLLYAHTETLEYNGSSIKLAFTHASLIGKSGQKDSFSFPEGEVTVAEQLAIKTYDQFHTFREEKKIWIENLHIWNRELPKEKYDDYILFHGHTPTPLYNKKYKEIGNFKPESALPYVRFLDSDTVNVRKSWNDLIFDRPFEDVISINVDTGAAYGKALTAIHLQAKQLIKEDSFRIYQTFLDVPRIAPDITTIQWKFIE